MDIKELIEEIAAMDPCADVPADKLALAFSLLLEESVNVIEIAELTDSGSSLPKVAGKFTYEGLPVHYRAVNRGGIYYIIFCTCHNGTSGNLGEKYILFKRNTEGVFMFYATFTAANAMDWVKRAFNECAASNIDPGLLSSDMYKNIDAVYDWCVSQGMTPIS